MSEEILSYKSYEKTLNDRVFDDYYKRLMLIARSVFKWEGLEELGIDEKWIERYLFSEGQCMFFKDPEFGLMVTKLTSSGDLNHYDEPTYVRPVATRYMKAKNYKVGKECVIIRNNDICRPTASTILLYAMKLTNIDRTIDVNVHAQKTPLIIRCPQGQKMTLKQVITKRDDNEFVIYGDKGLDVESIEVLKTDAPIVFDKLELQKHMVWNECLTFLGINNSNQDKRERLVTNEVEANNEMIEVSFNMMLKAREKACEEINKLFGTKISVKKRAETELPLNDETEDENDNEEV